MGNTLENTTDTTNLFAGPGFRIIYTIFTCISLGLTLSTGTGLFIGLLVLSFGLAADYLKFTPKSKLRKCSRGFGFIFNIGIMLVCFGALFGGATAIYSYDLPLTSTHHLMLPKGASVEDYTDASNLYILITKVSPFGTGYSFPARIFWLIICGACTFFTIVDRFTEKRELESYLTDANIGEAQAAATKEDVEEVG